MPVRSKAFFKAAEREKKVKAGLDRRDEEPARLSNATIAFFVFVVVGSSVFQLLRVMGFG